MAFRRFFVPPEFICYKETRLPDAEARHLRNVLRIREGECIEIFDGRGNSWYGTVEVRRGEVFVCGLSRAQDQAHSRLNTLARLTLAAAMIKLSRFEWALEKVTELGVDAIVPLYTDRGEIRISGEKTSDRLARWERITKEASKQCRRLDVPCLRSPMEFRDFLSSEEYLPQTKILFHEKSNTSCLPDLMKNAGDTIICIGPEGGWTDDEIESAEKAGCGVFSLGQRVLRAETAAIAAVSVFQYHRFEPIPLLTNNRPLPP